MNNALAAVAAAKAIDALADLHQSHDSVTRTRAIERACAGLPAYWTTATYANQVAGIVLDAANSDIGLAIGLIKVRAEDGRTSARSRDFLLGTLIPLNTAAKLELEKARGF